ncbi:glycoside hydrolase family 3 N-terminal domain-containing protein [Algirhabdus cladophorae]|uniref:glycoside hydrolase family 3 N-terminal domain-containing protein n=1 Tax=Algirhabdus cladophorae TaxID=3377108 RepID=UPI003B846E58
MAAGAYILGCSGPVLSKGEAAFFREADPWGFILFGRNIVDPTQLAALTASLRETVGRDAPILIDQEGGRVQRLVPPHWIQWQPPLDQMDQAGPLSAARSMFLRYRVIADELRRVGIDANCAPMADIAMPQTHEFLKNRCYGADVVTVVGAARAVANGLLAGGVLPVLKHLPGHGRAVADSHFELPRVTASRETLWDTDFAPFKALIDLPMAMTAHIVFSAFDEAPATTSELMMSLIRTDMGYDGLVMTDDISMQALDGSIASRCTASMQAGCDVILHCNGDMDEMLDVAQATGTLGADAARRAQAALDQRHAPDGIDIEAAIAEFDALMNVNA